MKKNATDAGAMIGALRADLDEIDRDVRRAVVELERDLRPLARLREIAEATRAGAVGDERSGS
jgi:hypothetical protein